MARGTLTMDVQLRGFREMGRRIDGALEEGGFLAEPWQGAMKEIGVLGEQAVITTAPMGGGGTIARMSHKVHMAAIPKYVVIKTTAKRGRFPYPRFTNYSPVSSRLRPLTKAGAPRRARPNPNKGWFQRGIQRVWGVVPTIMEKAARNVEQRWSSYF